MAHGSHPCHDHGQTFWGQNIWWCICLALSVPHLLKSDLWESTPFNGDFLGECIHDGGTSCSGDLQSLVVLAGDCWYACSHCQPYIHRYVVATEVLEEEFDGYSKHILYIRMIAFVEVKSCFGFLFAAGALIGNSGIFVGRFGGCLCFPVLGILIINFINPPQFFLKCLVNSGDGSLHILPVHCTEHTHCPISPPLRYSSIPLVDVLIQ